MTDRAIRQYAKKNYLHGKTRQETLDELTKVSHRTTTYLEKKIHAIPSMREVRKLAKQCFLDGKSKKETFEELKTVTYRSTADIEKVIDNTFVKFVPKENNVSDYITDNNEQDCTELMRTVKSLLIRLLYLGLCLIPVFIFADSKVEIKLITLPFLLTGIFQVIIIIGLFMDIVAETEFSWLEKFWIASFIVAFIIFLLQLKNQENTIDETKLVWTARAVGFGLATTLTIIIKIIRQSVCSEYNGNYIVLFVVLFFLSSVLFMHVNYQYADNVKTCETYAINNKRSVGRTPVYVINVTFDDATEKEFSVGKRRYDTFNKGDTVEICIAKGLFGFDFASDFNKINQ